METIIYQGQPLEAKLVNYLSGTIPTSTVDADGDEELFRDSQGRYYLRRTLNLLADYHEDGGEGNIEASGRTLVHRLNVNAAILWATTRLNSETLDLRRDAANLIMENRGYLEPNPVHLNASRRSGLAAAAQPVCTVDGPVSGAMPAGRRLTGTKGRGERKKPRMTSKRQLGASNSQTGEFLSLPYAGTRIKVQVVDSVGGAYKPGYASEEIIGRTTAGEYFLAREISVDWVEPRPPAFTLPGEGFWLRVKRLSFRAAMLYITRNTASAFKVDLLRAMLLGSEQKECA